MLGWHALLPRATQLIVCINVRNLFACMVSAITNKNVRKTFAYVPFTNSKNRHLPIDSVFGVIVYRPRKQLCRYCGTMVCTQVDCAAGELFLRTSVLE